MKMAPTRTIISSGVILGLVCGLASLADLAAQEHQTAPEKPPAVANQELDKFEGTIAVLNEAERTVTVDGFWTTRTFNTAADCGVTTGGTSASFGDLRPGQKVEVRYSKLDGVRIAKQINQQDQVYTGRIMSLDSERRIMEVGNHWKSREFAFAPGCSVVLRDKAGGTIDDLRTGERVAVVFESPPDKSYQARSIEQRYQTFSGTVRAIDADARTVRAKTLLNEEKFNLGNNCKIVLTDNTEGTLKDLKIGDKVRFAYESEDGVLVANLITQEQEAPQEDGTVQVSAPRRP